MNVAEILLLGVLAAFWPTLLVVVIVAIRAPHPFRILIAFLVGGLLTCVTIGAVVIHLLRKSELISDSQHTTDPVVEITCGVLALVAAYALGTQCRGSPQATGGVFLAFGVGIVLNIVPGVVPIVAIKDIAELDIGRAETLTVLLAFYVIMFSFVEIPLVGYVFAPSRTQSAVTRFNAWLNVNAIRLGIWALVAAGLYLIVRGTVGALT